jgi:quercetin dioxygenase-like cupin family protein
MSWSKSAALGAAGFGLGMIVGCTTVAVVAQDAPAEEAAASSAPAEGARASVITRADEAQVKVAPSGKAMAAMYAMGEQAYFGRLELDAGAAVPEHADPTEEFIYVLSGGGTMRIDGATHEVGPQTLVYMPAGAVVSFTNGPERLVALQVFAGPGPAAKYDAWAPR